MAFAPAIESLCAEAGLGTLSKTTASRICEELRERFEQFKRSHEECQDRYVELNGDHESESVGARASGRPGCANTYVETLVVSDVRAPVVAVSPKATIREEPVSRMLKLLVWAAAFALLLAASSAADTPTKTTTTDEFTTVVDNVCGFPITIESTLTTTAITLTDASGSPRRLQLHVVEQDVFSANDVSLTSTPYTFNQQIIFDPSGNAVHAYASGQVVRIPLPDGSVFFSAGRLDFVTFGGQFALTPEVGLSGDTTALCAALAG